jgi:23S rRNA (uracil1939-C5)-methyltransferase
MQDVSYVRQLEWKEQNLKNIFSSLLGPTVTWLPILGSPDEYPVFFRNKIRFAFVEREGKIWPSRHQKGDDEADIAVRECFLQSEEANQVIRFVAEYGEKAGWTLFNSKDSTGWLKHILIRQGKQTGEMLISLVTTAAPLEAPDVFIEAVQKELPFVCSLYQTKTQGRNNFESEDVHLWGSEAIHERIGDLLFRISPHSFFQTNSAMVETLYTAIRTIVKEKEPETVWDLYAGSASIGLFVGQDAKEVVAIEPNPQNIADAAWNIAHNQAHNVKIFEGTVEDVCSSQFLHVNARPDLVIVDPPRAGLSEKTRNLLTGLRPASLVYVSCNPATCLQDCKDLVRRGFKLSSIQGVDMFPHTIHCEMIAVFER